MKKTVILIVSIAIILLISGGLLIYMETSPRFDIERIGIRGHSRLVPELIVKQLNIQPHTNIFQLQLDTIQQQLESLEWVKTAEIYRNFPNKLSIELTERTPIALVKLDELHLVDQEGVILGSLASGSAIHLPIITGSFVVDINRDAENPKLEQALCAIDAIIHSSIPLLNNIRKIHIQSLENTTFLSHTAGPEVRMSLTNYQQSLQRLEKIYLELNLENLALIDLRFDRRIIVTPNNS